MARNVVVVPGEGHGRGVFTEVVNLAVKNPGLGIRLSDTRNVAIVMGWFHDPAKLQESFEETGEESPQSSAEGHLRSRLP